MKNQNGIHSKSKISLFQKSQKTFFYIESYPQYSPNNRITDGNYFRQFKLVYNSEKIIESYKYSPYNRITNRNYF